MAGYQGTTILRFTASFTNLGNVDQALALTGRSGLGPWAKGKILYIHAVLAGGPATTVDFRLRETVPSNNDRVAFTAEPFPAKVQPAGGPVPYIINTGTELELVAQTDDGTFNSDVDFFIDIEGPF